VNVYNIMKFIGEVECQTTVIKRQHGCTWSVMRHFVVHKIPTMTTAAYVSFPWRVPACVSF